MIRHLVLDKQSTTASGLVRASCDVIDASPGFALLAL